MSKEPTLPSLGNPRIDAAAHRLNQAFLRLEEKMQNPQIKGAEKDAEIELLENENMRLHEELAQLNKLLEEVDKTLEVTGNEVATMMEKMSLV